MRDYAVRTPQNDAEPPGSFSVGAGVRLNYRVMDKTDGAEETGLDVSGSRWQLMLRGFAPGATELVFDEELDKSLDDAADGYFDHYFYCGDTAYPAMRWRFVLVDRDNPQAGTKSTKR